MGNSDQAKSYLSRGGSFALRLIANFAKALWLDLLAFIVYTYIYCRGFAYEKKGGYDQAIAQYDQALNLAAAYNHRGLAYHLVGLLFSVLVIVLPLLDLAAAYNHRGLAYYLAASLVPVVIALPLSGLFVAYNRKLAHYLVGRFLAGLLVVVLLYNNREFVHSAALLFALLLLTYILYNNRGIAVAITYSNRGLAYGKQGNYDQAIKDCTKAIQLKPKDALAYIAYILYNNRGLAYCKRGDYKKAIEDYTKAIQLKPKYALAYHNRGFAHEVMSVSGTFDGDMFDRAIEDYDDALRLRPSDYRKYYKDYGDYMDPKFAYRGKVAVETPVEKLAVKIKGVLPSCLPARAAYSYYSGVKSLLENNRLKAWEHFVKAKELDYDDGDSGRTLARHLDNLDDISKTIEGNHWAISIYSEPKNLGIAEERLRGILTTLTQDRD